MSLEDFQNLFSSITINYYEDNFTHTSFKDKLTKGSMISYELTITSPGDYFITISQKDLRHHKGRITTYDPLGLMLVEQKGDKVTYRGGIQGMARDNWIKVSLSPGTYHIFVRNFLNNKN